MQRDAFSALTRAYPAGTVLFEENDPGSRMFVIRTGRVRIFRRVADSEIVLAFLGPGEFFGEMALLENLPRSATAETMEPTMLIEVDGTTFEEMVHGNAEIAVRMLRKLASRVRESDRRIQNLLGEGDLGRAVEVLRWLLPQGAKEGSFVRLAGAASQVDLAMQAGIPPMQAGAVFERLQRAGCLKVDGEDLLIADRSVLDAFSNYLDLKRKYEAPGPQLPSEAMALKQEERMRAMRRLLKALKLTPEDLAARQQALSAQYARYVELKRKFAAAHGDET